MEAPKEIVFKASEQGDGGYISRWRLCQETPIKAPRMASEASENTPSRGGILGRGKKRALRASETLKG